MYIQYVNTYEVWNKANVEFCTINSIWTKTEYLKLKKNDNYQVKSVGECPTEFLLLYKMCFSLFNVILVFLHWEITQTMIPHMNESKFL